jgi:hypothetical protein
MQGVTANTTVSRTFDPVQRNASMALESSILKGSARLEEVSGGGRPVRPAPPHDDPDAVRRIQKALKALLKIPMSKSFTNGPDAEPDGKYGEETMQAVIAFQKQAFPKDSSQWDGRVGQLTLGKMDAALGKGGGGGGGGGVSTEPFTVVPFNEPVPFLISQQKDDRTKGDLDASKRASLAHLPLTTRAKINAARAMPTQVLEVQMLAELSGGGQLGRDMGNTFIKNSSVQVVPFIDGSALSNEVRNSQVFKTAHADVRNEITKVFKASIAARKVVDFHDLAAARKVITPPVFGFSLTQRSKAQDRDRLASGRGGVSQQVRSQRQPAPVEGHADLQFLRSLRRRR